jgi:glycosyltransferase involved in cell wall biosynthesis
MPIASRFHFDLACPKKILFLVSQFRELGGAEKNLLDLMNGLSERGFDCQLGVLQGGYLSTKAKKDGYAVIDFSLKKIISTDGVRKGWKLMKKLQDEKINTVVTYHRDADFWGGLFARLARVPVIISSRRDMGYLLGKTDVWCYRLLNGLFTRIVTVSDAVQETVRLRERVAPSKITTIRNGVHLEENKRDVERWQKKSELGLDPTKLTVGMVASFRPVKGQEYFVEAARLILNECPNTQFLIVGSKDSDYFFKVNEQIKKNDLSSHIHCVGHREDVSDILQTLDVFVLSSLHEGFSNALIEALARGIPAVASDSGGNPEAIINGQTGFLVKPRDGKSLSVPIIRLLKSEALRKTMGNSAREDVANRFTHDAMVDAVSRLLMDLHQSTGKETWLPKEKCNERYERN